MGGLSRPVVGPSALEIQPRGTTGLECVEWPSGLGIKWGSPSGSWDSEVVKGSFWGKGSMGLVWGDREGNPEGERHPLEGVMTCVEA